MISNPEHVIFSAKDAAEYLGIKENTLAVWACTKRYNLPYIKIGSKRMYDRRDLDAFIMNNKRIIKNDEISENKITYLIHYIKNMTDNPVIFLDMMMEVGLLNEHEYAEIKNKVKL